MNKAERFKLRVQRHGQTVTLYPFVAYASGAYVDADWNAPDPDDSDYPDTGSPPGPEYGDAQEVKALVQPARGSSGGQRFVRTPAGEEIDVRLRAYFPYDVEVAHRDRVLVDGDAHWVASLEPWTNGGSVVYRLAWLSQEVA